MSNAQVSMIEKLRQEAARRKAIQERKGGDANKYLKIEYGEVKLRFLPSKDGENVFFKEFGEHWIDKKRFMCPKVTKQEKCPICEAVYALYKTNDENDKELAKTFKARKQNYANVIVRGKEAEGPKIFKFGSKLADQIINYCIDEDYYDLSDPSKGYDFKVVKEKKDGFPNYDKSKPSKDSTSVSSEDLEKWMATATDFGELIESQMQSYDDMKKEFEGFPTSTSAESEDDAPSGVETEAFDESKFMDEVNKAIPESKSKKK